MGRRARDNDQLLDVWFQQAEGRTEVFQPVFGHAMLTGKVNEFLFCAVKNSVHHLLSLLVAGRLIRRREGFLEVAQDVIEYNPQFTRDLVQREALLSELSHMPTDLFGCGDNVVERASELVDLFRHTELALGSIKPLVGRLQESI